MERPRVELVLVPDLVGLDVPYAREVAHEAGIVPVTDNPDGPGLGARSWPGPFVITHQWPVAGEFIPRFDPVTVWFTRGRGGEGSHDRLPEDPPTPELRAHAVPEDEPVIDALPDLDKLDHRSDQPG